MYVYLRFMIILYFKIIWMRKRSSSCKDTSWSYTSQLHEEWSVMYIVQGVRGFTYLYTDVLLFSLQKREHATAVRSITSGCDVPLDRRGRRSSSLSLLFVPPVSSYLSSSLSSSLSMLSRSKHNSRIRGTSAIIFDHVQNYRAHSAVWAFRLGLQPQLG